MKFKNNYVRILGKTYDKIPKEVLGAVVVSVLRSHGKNLDEMELRILDEWLTLYNAGVLDTRPPDELVLPLISKTQEK